MFNPSMGDTSQVLPWKSSSTLRIVFQNVHGLPKHNQHPKHNSLQSFLNNYQIDLFRMSEVNIAWHNVTFHECLGSQTTEWFESRHVMTA